MITNKTYGPLKGITQILLPVLGALYFGVDQLWGLPKALEVVGIIMILDALLGVWLSLWLNSQIIRGTIDFIETDEKLSFSLNLNDDPTILKEKSKALFDIVAGGDDLKVPPNG